MMFELINLAFLYIFFQDLYSEELVNMFSVQSKLEDIAFKKKMECSYARNPYTNHQLRQATSEDVVQHISRNENSFNMVTNGGDADNVRELPHGRGKLKTVTGEVVYNGEWCKGKVLRPQLKLSYHLWAHTCSKGLIAQQNLYQYQIVVNHISLFVRCVFVTDVTGLLLGCLLLFFSLFPYYV